MKVSTGVIIEQPISFRGFTLTLAVNVDRVARQALFFREDLEQAFHKLTRLECFADGKFGGWKSW